MPQLFKVCFIAQCVHGLPKTVVLIRGKLSAIGQALPEVGASVFLVNEGSGGLISLPLDLHPALWAPRTLTAPAALTTAIDRTGCGGTAGPATKKNSSAPKAFSPVWLVTPMLPS